MKKTETQLVQATDLNSKIENLLKHLITNGEHVTLEHYLTINNISGDVRNNAEYIRKKIDIKQWLFFSLDNTNTNHNATLRVIIKHQLFMLVANSSNKTFIDLYSKKRHADIEISMLYKSMSLIMNPTQAYTQTIDSNKYHAPVPTHSLPVMNNNYIDANAAKYWESVAAAEAAGAAETSEEESSESYASEEESKPYLNNSSHLRSASAKAPVSTQNLSVMDDIYYKANAAAYWESVNSREEEEISESETSEDEANPLQHNYGTTAESTLTITKKPELIAAAVPTLSVINKKVELSSTTPAPVAAKPKSSPTAPSPAPTPAVTKKAKLSSTTPAPVETKLKSSSAAAAAAPARNKKSKSNLAAAAAAAANNELDLFKPLENYEFTYLPIKLRGPKKYEDFLSCPEDLGTPSYTLSNLKSPLIEQMNEVLNLRMFDKNIRNIVDAIENILNHEGNALYHEGNPLNNKGNEFVMTRIIMHAHNILKLISNDKRFNNKKEKISAIIQDVIKLIDSDKMSKIYIKSNDTKDNMKILLEDIKARPILLTKFKDHTIRSGELREQSEALYPAIQEKPTTTRSGRTVIRPGVPRIDKQENSEVTTLIQYYSVIHPDNKTISATEKRIQIKNLTIMANARNKHVEDCRSHLNKELSAAVLPKPAKLETTQVGDRQEKPVETITAEDVVYYNKLRNKI